jgi:hypothetical protein
MPDNHHKVRKVDPIVDNPDRWRWYDWLLAYGAIGLYFYLCYYAVNYGG